MLRSALFAPVQRSGKKDEASHSAYYFSKMGYTSTIGAGLYTHLPLGHILFNNVKAVLNQELENLAQCSFHEFPGIAPEALWQTSGRLDLFGKSIFRYEDQHGKSMILAPTHEVTAAATAAQLIQSYKELPVRISQIQNKFRDETRPRAGVIRSRQFQMHDLYSFDTDRDAASLGYARVKQAYENTFRKLRIPAIAIEQTDMGAIGGDGSHEFHCPADIGDDTIIDHEGRSTPSLELAHIFMLGTGYSEAMSAYYVDKDNIKKPVYMCSFGMGIERTAAAYIERNIMRDNRSQELIWSWHLSPFQVMLLGNTPECYEAYHRQKKMGRRCLLDDRDTSFREKLAQGHQLGFPIYIIQGPKDDPDKFQIICRPLALDCTISVYDLDVALDETIAKLMSHEIVNCFGTTLDIDTHQKHILGIFKSVTAMQAALDNQYNVSSSKMGAFGQRSNEKLERGKCGDYWLKPIVEAETDTHSIENIDGLKYLIWPKHKEYTVGKLKALIN